MACLGPPVLARAALRLWSAQIRLGEPAARLLCRGLRVNVSASTPTHPSRVVATNRRQRVTIRPRPRRDVAGQLLVIRQRLNVDRREFVLGLDVVRAGYVCGCHTTSMQTGAADVQSACQYRPLSWT